MKPMRELPTTLYGARQVAELDRRVIEDHGVDGFDLMQRAASAAYRTLRAHWPQAQRLLVLCGPGNNGGDGFLVGKLALDDGLTVGLQLLADRRKVKGDAAKALAAFEAAGGEVEGFDGDVDRDVDVIVDAMLGTGLGRPVEGRFRDAVLGVNAAHARGAGVFAVDVPSGLDADRGGIWGVAVAADVTATFIGCKLGLLTGAGPDHAGRVAFDDLDAPAAAYQGAAYMARRMDDAAIREALPRRARAAHKRHHGHLLCVGGNVGMGGAVRMAAEAALRVGAGLVSVATRPENAAAMTQARPELMCRGIETDADLDILLARATVAALGPGLDQDDWARRLWRRLLDTDLPLVVDADGLNLLAEQRTARGRWVLTPHPGEAARLLGTDTAAIQGDRPAAAEAIARDYDAVVVLKGPGSLITWPDGELWVCTEGNPGMAVGGMGDVLTGVIAGLLSQGLPPAMAARLGATVHARAGDAAAAAGGERGLLPGDLLLPLRAQVNPIW